MNLAMATAHQLLSKPKSVLIEPLESRTHFDVVPTISGTLPVALVATVKNSSAVTVDLTNNGAAAVSGSCTLTLFASTAPTFGAATDTQISTISKSGAFAPGKAFPIKFKLTDFPDVANGSYFLLAEVSGSLAGTSDNVAASTGTIAVTDPFIDLSASVSTVPPTSVLPGKTAGVSVEVFNNGNVPAAGALLIDLGLTVGVIPSSTTIRPEIEESIITVGTPTSHIHIAAGGHQIVRLHTKIPVGFTPANYLWDIGVDPNNTFSESDTTNNSAISTGTLTVLDPYQNIVDQTFAGPDKIKKGPDKGSQPTIDLDFLTEDDTTGAITATGVLFEGDGVTADFNFSGTISTKGVFLGEGSSPNSVFVATYKGKLTKTKLTGTEVNTDGNSGVFSLLMETSR